MNVKLIRIIVGAVLLAVAALVEHTVPVSYTHLTLPTTERV